MVLNNSAYYIFGVPLDKLKFLWKILSSKVLYWYYKTISVQLGSSAVRMFSIYVEKLPIPNVKLELQKSIIVRVDSILAAKKEEPEADTTALEAEIDQLVYKLYGLSDEEIAVIEGRDTQREKNVAKQDAADQSPVKASKQSSRPKASRRRHADDDDYLE